MSVQMIIELHEKQGAQPILQAIESYKARLQSGLERTQRRLAQFEQRYGVDTEQFLREMTSEDLDGGDLEYVVWAGEAQLLEGLKSELMALDLQATNFLPPSTSSLASSSVARRKTLAHLRQQ